jgi:hypothetical protein
MNSQNGNDSNRSSTLETNGNHENRKKNIINQIYGNDIYTDQDFYEKRKQEFGILDSYLKRKKDIIRDFKNDVLEHKEEYVETFQIILQKYGKQFQQDDPEIDYIDIYKNFIFVMVLLLNEDIQIKYLYQDVLESNLQLDSFYAPFRNEIEMQSRKNENGKIEEFDINIIGISHDDKRLISHMVMFGENLSYVIFKNNFINYVQNINTNKNQLNVLFEVQQNIKNRILNIQINKKNMNMFELINYLLKLIISSNSIDFMYFDNFQFIIKFIENKKLQNINVFILLLYSLRIIDLINIDLTHKGERTELCALGSRNMADNLNINVFMCDNIFSAGKYNILFTYVKNFIIKKYVFEDYDFNILIEKIMYNYLVRIPEYKLTVMLIDYLERFKTIKYSKIILNDIKQLLNQNKTIDQEYYIKKIDVLDLANPEQQKKNLNYLINDIINLFNIIFTKNNKINYFKYLQYSNKIYIGRYFNLSQYPIFYYFNLPETNKKIFYNKDIFQPEYQQIFELFKTPDILYRQKIKLYQYIYFLCKMNFDIQQQKSSFHSLSNENKENIINHIFITNQQELLEMDEVNFINKFLPQNRKTEDLLLLNQLVDFILEPIQQFLEKKYEYFDLCLFYYSFFNYMELLYISISIENNVSKRIRNLNNESKIQSIDNIVKYMIIDYMGYLRPATKEILKKKWMGTNENIIYQNMQRFYNYNFEKMKEGKININHENKNHPDYKNIFLSTEEKQKIEENIRKQKKEEYLRKQKIKKIINKKNIPISNLPPIYRKNYKYKPNYSEMTQLGGEFTENEIEQIMSSMKEISQNERSEELKKNIQTMNSKNIFQKAIKKNEPIQQQIKQQQNKYEKIKKIIQKTEQEFENIKPDLIQMYKTSNINQLQKIYDKTKNQDLKQILNRKKKLNELKQQYQEFQKNYEENIKPIFNKTLYNIEKLQRIEKNQEFKKLFILHEDISIKKKNQKILKDIYDLLFINLFQNVKNTMKTEELTEKYGTSNINELMKLQNQTNNPKLQQQIQMNINPLYQTTF